MSLVSVISGDYGQVIKLTMIDTDTDAAADVSAYSTSQAMLFQDPDGIETSKVAAFDSDGTDGIIKYTLVDGDIHRSGIWQVRARVVSGSAVLTSERINMPVGGER